MMKNISTDEEPGPASAPTDFSPAIGTAAMTPPPRRALDEEAEAETGVLLAFDEEDDADLPSDPQSSLPAGHSLADAPAVPGFDEATPLASADASETLDLDALPHRAGADPKATVDPQRRTTVRRDARHRGPLGSNAAKRTVSISPGATLAASSSSEERAPLLPNGDVPDFILKGIIGRGGQGEVWEAWQSSLQRLVAVKCLRSGEIGEFLQEAYTSGELDHPNIVPVYDLGRVHDGTAERPLLAMKLVHGQPWNDMLEDDRNLRKEKPEVFMARHLRILVDVCNAVAYAHSKGIIHRDLKPSQVMVGHFGEVFLMDWGLAVSVNEEVPVVVHESMPKHSTLRTASNRCGSPAYMAPEQTLDSTIGLGLHTDLYLLGAVLFEIVSGYPPHAAETAEGAYFMAVLNEVGELPEDCPSDLRRLIDRCLETEPEGRPKSAQEFRDTVEDYLSGAGRQRESRELVAAVEKVFTVTPLERMDYGHVSQLSQRLSRALQLWPDNFHGESVRQSILARHAELAFEHGDLQLAYSLAGSIADDEQRANMLRSIDMARKRARLMHRQRQILLYSSFILMALVIVVGSVYTVREARLREDKARKEAENLTQAARRDLYMQRAEEAMRSLQQAEVRAELVEQALALRESEEELARRIGVALPLPEILLPDDRATSQTLSASKAARDLLRERASLAAQRSDLVSQGMKLPSEPFDLLLGEANNLLLIASQKSDIEHAYELYREAHLQHTQIPEPLVGMGIAAARSGNPRQAAAHLEEASMATRLFYGGESVEYARALSLQADAVALLGPPSAGLERELRQNSLEILQKQWKSLAGLLGAHYRSLGRTDQAEQYERLTR